jgi:hypothetical protein
MGKKWEKGDFFFILEGLKTFLSGGCYARYASRIATGCAFQQAADSPPSRAGNLHHVPHAARSEGGLEITQM